MIKINNWHSAVNDLLPTGEADSVEIAFITLFQIVKFKKISLLVAFHVRKMFLLALQNEYRKLFKMNSFYFLPTAKL